MLPTRVGSAVRGQTDLRSLVRRGVGPAHRLPRNVSSVPCLSILPAGHTGTPCSSTLRQQVRGVINHQGGLMWAQTNLHSLKAAHVPGKMNQGLDMLSRNNFSSEEWMLHPLAVQKIWEVFDRAWVDLFASKDKSHCPNFFTKSLDVLAHEWPSLPLYPSNHSATAGTQASQETTVFRKVRKVRKVYSNSPPSGGTSRMCQCYSSCSKQPHGWSLETGPPLSSERHAMTSTARVMGPACVAALREPFILPERVLNTMAEARAPSTRRLYALKWSIFSAWCQDCDLDPVTSNVSCSFISAEDAG